MNDLPEIPTARDSLLPLFDAIDDVPLELRGELDRRHISFRELLELGVGEIIQLNRPAGEPIDLYAGQELIGCAEIVVMDGVMNLRLAEMVDGPPGSDFREIGN